MAASNTPGDFQDSFADLLATVMVLAKGKLMGGEHYWAYLAMKPSMMLPFKKAQAKGSFDLEDYGTVIEWGKGSEPPAEVQMRMKTDYAVGSDYEKKLLERLEQLH